MVLKLWSLDQQPYYTWELVRNAGCLAPCRDTESETLEEGWVRNLSLSLFYFGGDGSVSHSVVSDSAIPRTVTHQAPLSMGFSRQEYWSELSFPSSEDLSDPVIEPRSPALQADSLPNLFITLHYMYSILSSSFLSFCLFLFWRIIALQCCVSFCYTAT